MTSPEVPSVKVAVIQGGVLVGEVPLNVVFRV